MNLDFVKIKAINKGWSSDKKYCATAFDNKKYLLRLSDLKEFNKKSEEFNLAKKISNLNLPICEPIDFGVINNKVYTIYSWIEGEDASLIIDTLDKNIQYKLGFEAGEYLNRIHSIPLDFEPEPWNIRFSRKIDTKIKSYLNCSTKFEGDELIISFLENNKNLLENRPQSYHHGDFHIGNMMIKDNKIKIIDFDRYDYGDPFEEFNRIVWSIEKSETFATGLVNGYFENNVPLEFWNLLCIYICSNSIGSIAWASSFSEEELIVMLNQINDVLGYYKNMTTIIPTWYKSDLI